MSPCAAVTPVVLWEQPLTARVAARLIIRLPTGPTGTDRGRPTQAGAARREIGKVMLPPRSAREPSRIQAGCAIISHDVWRGQTSGPIFAIALFSLLAAAVFSSRHDSFFSVPPVAAGVAASAPAACSHYVAAWETATRHWLRGVAPQSLSAAAFVRSLHHNNSCVIPVIIKDSVVRIIPPGNQAPLASWVRDMLDHLLDASQRFSLADAHFHISCSDWPLVPRSAGPPDALTLSMSSGDAAWDVPVPGHSHPRADPPADDFPAVRWSEREPRAHWRGTLMCESDGADCATRCSRLQLRRAAEAHPDLLDVRFTHVYENGMPPCHAELLVGIAEANNSALRSNAVVSVPRVRAKFLLAPAGHSYATGLKSFLANGAAVLRERTQFLEYFESALIPWVHYAPFDCRDAATDCRALDIGRAAATSAVMDDALRRVGEAGQDFARRHFSREALACYWRTLLINVQPLFAGASGVLPDEVAAELLPLTRPYSDVK